MRVLIQWARADPQGWEEHDISRVQDWRALPSKPQPTSQSQPVDNQPGWVNAVNVQGVIFSSFDQYSMAAAPDGGITALAWYDSSNDYPPGQRAGQVWTFLPPAPDPAIGGEINTRQTCVWYAEPGSDIAANLTEMGLPVQPWSAFPLPASNARRYGKWLDYPVFREHINLLRHPVTGVIQPGWREWVT